VEGISLDNRLTDSVGPLLFVHEQFTSRLVMSYDDQFRNTKVCYVRTSGRRYSRRLFFCKGLFTYSILVQMGNKHSLEDDLITFKLTSKQFLRSGKRSRDVDCMTELVYFELFLTPNEQHMYPQRRNVIKIKKSRRIS
jgi:hypothetical protein